MSLPLTQERFIAAIAEALTNTQDLRIPEGIKLGNIPLKKGYEFLGKAPPWLQALLVLEEELKAKALVYLRSGEEGLLATCVEYAEMAHTTAKILQDVIPVLHGYIGIGFHQDWRMSGIHVEAYDKIYRSK